MFDFEERIDRSGTSSIKWDGVGAGHLSMGLADMDLRTAPVVLDALRRQVEHGVFGYTAVGPDVLDTAISWVRDRRGVELRPEWLLACPGVMPSIAYLLCAELAPGDGVIVQTPAFAPIPNVVEANGFRVVESPLRMGPAGFEMDLHDLTRHAGRDDVRAFVLCSPHNPVGRVWSREELTRLGEICETHDLLIVSDEIHYLNPTTFRSRSPSRVPRVIRLNRRQP